MMRERGSGKHPVLVAFRYRQFNAFDEGRDINHRPLRGRKTGFFSLNRRRGDPVWASGALLA
jgi:hypothetical protein